MAEISGYKPFLVQKLTEGAEVRDSLDWNIYVKKVPFKIMGDLKEPFSRDWPDRNGSEVYYPTTPVYKSYDMECEFVYLGDTGTAEVMMKLFIRYLVENGMFKFYDTYTKIGRTNVYYKSLSPDIYKSSDKDVTVFKLILTVNDPVTDIVLTKSTT